MNKQGRFLGAVGRRDFLRALSASVGGALLTTGVGTLSSCGDAGRSSVANAYSFFAIRQGAGALPMSPKPASDAIMSMASPGEQLLHFQGDPMLSDDGQLIFQAIDINDTQSLRSLQLDFSAREPSTKSERVVVEVGQALDGRTVDHIDGVDASASGVIALVLSLKGEGDEVRHGLYADRHGQLTKLAVEGDQVDGDHVFSGIFHDVAVDNHHVLFVARYLHQATDVDDSTPNTGLFVVPLDGTAKPRLLVRTGDMPVSPEHPITGLGLVDLHGQHYVAEAYVRYRDPSVTDMTAPNGQQKIILQGTIDGRQPVVLAAESLLANAVDGMVHIGEQLSAPRIQDGRPLFMLRDENGHHHSFGPQGTRISTKDESPSGFQPLLISPAVPAANASSYSLQTVLSGDGLEEFSHSKRELIHTDARNRSSLLFTSGDQLVNDAREIWDISFGSFRQHVDSQHRVAASVLFHEEGADPNGPHPSALIVGIPV